MSIETDLKDLASKIVHKAKEDSTPLVEKIDAFKCLTTYYALVLKKRGKQTDGDDDIETMDGFREALKQAETEDTNGAGQRGAGSVRTRRGHRADA